MIEHVLYRMLMTSCSDYFASSHVIVLFARQKRMLPYSLKKKICEAIHHGEQENTSKCTRNVLAAASLKYYR
jgi:hypothetical protein